jgi:hypothetical protein
VSNKITKKVQNTKQGVPKIQQLIYPQKNEQSEKKEQEKYDQVLQAGRQIFAVSINILQLLHSMKDVLIIKFRRTRTYPRRSRTTRSSWASTTRRSSTTANPKVPNLKSGSELISEAVILEHKNKLLNSYSEKNIDGMVEVLLSLRVNSLQIAPELRKNLVNELINQDILLINQNKKFEFIISLLNYENSSMKHAITSLISVISSTYRGVEYLTTKNNMVYIYIQDRHRAHHQDHEDSGQRQRHLALLSRHPPEVFNQGGNPCLFRPSFPPWSKMTFSIGL